MCRILSSMESTHPSTAIPMTFSPSIASQNSCPIPTTFSSKLSAVTDKPSSNRNFERSSSRPFRYWVSKNNASALKESRIPKRFKFGLGIRPLNQ